MRCIKCFSGIFVYFLVSMVQSDATSEAIGGASAAKVSLGSPSWNLFRRLAPIRHQTKEFKTPYQLNPEITQKWEAAIAFTKTGIPSFGFIHKFDGLSAAPILADSGAELLEDYHKYQLKKHRKALWRKLFVKPQKALRKLAKLKVDFMGLGALYGTDDFGAE